MLAHRLEQCWPTVWNNVGPRLEQCWLTVWNNVGPRLEQCWPTVWNNVGPRLEQCWHTVWNNVGPANIGLRCKPKAHTLCNNHVTQNSRKIPDCQNTLSHNSKHVQPMLHQSWANVVGNRSVLKQHRFNICCLHVGLH